MVVPAPWDGGGDEEDRADVAGGRVSVSVGVGLCPALPRLGGALPDGCASVE
ncbi:hypothetical protein ACFQHO_14990 [Actinomadura yumaensis]|uniref:hypothetical protein n=1 Tax=Actinomadura TaxID=1988 RepID=UPI00136A6DB0|nr:hypothetical protein [Actinomadura sp. J1-007]